jgi:hypothetical protein
MHLHVQMSKLHVINLNKFPSRQTQKAKGAIVKSNLNTNFVNIS